MAGVVGWGRISPHPAFLSPESGAPRRVIPTSMAPITFFLREDAHWMDGCLRSRELPESALAACLSPLALHVRAQLECSGAAFAADLARQLGASTADLHNALWELVAAGLVTADGFDSLRALIDPHRKSANGAPFRMRGANHRARNTAGRWSLLAPPNPSPVILSEAKDLQFSQDRVPHPDPERREGEGWDITTVNRNVILSEAKNLQFSHNRVPHPDPEHREWEGWDTTKADAATNRVPHPTQNRGPQPARCSQVGVESVGWVCDDAPQAPPPRGSNSREAAQRSAIAAAQQREQEIESAALVLLWRYGILFRDLLERETTMPRWRELLGMLRRLEARGIVRGGRFVSGFQGEQFALPQAVESLRESRKSAPSRGEASSTDVILREAKDLHYDTVTVTISAADPANLVGIVVPGDRPAAIVGRTVQFAGGHFVHESAPDTIAAIPPQIAHPTAEPAQLALGHD